MDPCDTILYQIYPLGLCGAPARNDGRPAHRLLRVLDFIPHIRSLGATAVLLNPLFESDAHGYDTRDYRQVDCRLGDGADLQRVCGALHDAGLHILLDGVFNHVGRGFWAFRDVRERKWDSPYKDWFHLSFDGDSPYGDGFWYEGWEGHYELVKLNLRNPAVRDHIFDALRSWVKDYGIDGLRLDVAYCLDPDFLAALRAFTDGLRPGFLLMGETLHGDYNRWLHAGACHTVTNYECYKGIYSSFNSTNMHEIAYSLNRQFGPEPWCLYTGKPLVSFVDNHDVTRIASLLRNRAHLPLAYGLLFGMPGMPALYYGSEWVMEGRKEAGDEALRPAVETPVTNQLTAFLKTLIAARRGSAALRYGGYRNLCVQPAQLIFERAWQGERVLVALNAADSPAHLRFDSGAGRGADLLTGETWDLPGSVTLPPYSCFYWRMEG